MYALLNIPERINLRVSELAENFNFFGAPAAIFCYVDRQMGPPQWSDLGMFLQSFIQEATKQVMEPALKRRGPTEPKQSEFVEADLHSCCFVA